MIIASIKNYQIHQELLRIKGCQLEMEADTGRRVYCGKACSRAEKIQLYECADGRRVEIDGQYLGGVKD